MFSRRVRKAEDHGPRISNESGISATAHACDEEDKTRLDQTGNDHSLVIQFESNRFCLDLFPHECLTVIQGGNDKSWRPIMGIEYMRGALLCCPLRRQNGGPVGVSPGLR